MLYLLIQQIDIKWGRRCREPSAPSPLTAYWSGRVWFWRPLTRARTPRISPAPTSSSAPRASASALNSATSTSFTAVLSEFELDFFYVSDRFVFFFPFFCISYWLSAFVRRLNKSWLQGSLPRNVHSWLLVRISHPLTSLDPWINPIEIRGPEKSCNSEPRYRTSGSNSSTCHRGSYLLSYPLLARWLNDAVLLRSTAGRLVSSKADWLSLSEVVDPECNPRAVQRW